ncbi:MAG TPA: hypothetical protein VFZ41_03515 [Solirubrobacterales bacterium]
MEASERDTTVEWLLPEGSRPPLMHELEARVDEALALARASESAVMTVGAAALDAAEQARRAADLAERASAEVFARPGAGMGPEPEGAPAGPVRSGATSAGEDESLREFTARADRIAARLKALEKGSLRALG